MKGVCETGWKGKRPWFYCCRWHLYSIRRFWKAEEISSVGGYTQGEQLYIYTH